MDNSMFRYLAALKRGNKALLEGLKTSLYVMDNWYEFTPERRSFLKDNLKGIIKRGEEAFGLVLTKH